MAIGSFVAGAADGSWVPHGGDAGAPFDLGILDGDGFAVEVTHLKQVIQDTDRYGASAIAAVRRGGNCFMEWTFQEWQAATLMVAFPDHPPAVTGVDYLAPDLVGGIDPDTAGSLVLAAEAGTPAANSPATVGAAFPVVAEDYPLKFLLTSKQRTLKVRLRIYPYVDVDDGKLKWLTFS